MRDVKSRPTTSGVLLLAATVALSILPTYHGQQHRPGESRVDSHASLIGPAFALLMGAPKGDPIANEDAEKFIAKEFDIARCEAWSRDDLDYASGILGGCGNPSTDGWPLALPDDALDRGVRALGGQRLRRVLHRLKSGHPLHVLALGGSITEQGGCWGAGCSSSDGSAERGNISAWLSASGRSDMKQRNLGPEEPGRPIRTFWLSRFMQWVNYTWPHSDHAAFNHGWGGHGSYAVEECPADYLYPGADLVIVEFAVNGGAYESLQSLLVSVMRLPKRPAVLFMNAFWWCRDPDGSEGLRTRSAGECEDELKSEDLGRLQLATSDQEPGITQLAIKYNLSSVSIYHALMPLVLEARPQLVPLHRITDGMHPRDKFGLVPYGAYLSDLMVQWMHTAASAPESLASEVDMSVAPHCEDLMAGGIRETCQSPAKTIKCFDWFLHARPQIMSNLEGEGVVPERYQGVIVKSDFESPEPTTEKPIDAGWFYSRFPIDGNEEVLGRLRPGMVSVVPGAMADIVLPMAQVAPQYRKAISAIEVSYFVSYEHMGIVQLECAGGCACEPQLVDGHTPKAFSGADTAVLNMTSFGGREECVIRARNVGRTDGREGSKVKLLGFYLKSLTGSTAQIIKEAEASMYYHNNPNEF